MAFHDVTFLKRLSFYVGLALFFHFNGRKWNEFVCIKRDKVKKKAKKILSNTGEY